MEIQVKHITDSKGKIEAVQIPIEDWENIQALIKRLRQQQAVKNSLSRSTKEVKEMMAGKRKKKTIEDFLNEL